MVAVYMHNASDAVRMFTLDGVPAGEVTLPEIGSLTGITGRPDDPELFFGFTSFVHPAVNYRFDLRTRQLSRFGESGDPRDSRDYETSQVWYHSRDGTRVSMFLVRRKDLPKDGNRPVLLS